MEGRRTSGSEESEVKGRTGEDTQRVEEIGTRTHLGEAELDLLVPALRTARKGKVLATKAVETQGNVSVAPPGG